MFLRVTSRKGMWGYGNLWLTFADPKPFSIDLDLLDTDTRTQVDKAMAVGDLIEVDKDNRPIKRKSTKTQHSVVSAEPQTENILNPMMTQRLEAVMDGNVESVRREVALFNSLDVIQAALQIEQDNKNRKTVVGLLEKQLIQLSEKQNEQGNPYSDRIVDDEEVEIVFDVEQMRIESQQAQIELEMPEEETVKEA